MKHDHDFIAPLFLAFEESKVCYVVLRNDENLADDSDIDLLVSHIDQAKADEILRSLGFSYFKLPSARDDRFYMRYDEILKRFIQVQLSFDLHYGRVKFFYDDVASDMLKQRVVKEDYYVLCPKDFLRHVAMHCLLDKGTFEKYREKIEVILKENSGLTLQLPGCGELMLKQLMNAPKSRLKELKKKIQGALFLQSFRREITSFSFRFTRLAIKKLFGLKPMRPGVKIAFIGTDGAGKSTTLQGVRELLPWPAYSRIIYMGDNHYMLPFMRPLQEFKIKQKEKRMWLSSLFLLFGTIDKWLRAWRGSLRAWRGEVVLFDRWFHDLLTNPDVKKGTLKYKLKKILFFMSPKPDLLVMLYADVEVIYARNREFDREHISTARKLYLDVVQTYSPEALKVDTTHAPEKVVQTCVRAIWGQWTRRAHEA